MGLKRVVLLAVLIGAIIALTSGQSGQYRGGMLPAHRQVRGGRSCDAPISGMKPGRCPRQILTSPCPSCNDHCQSDYDCPGNSKCCAQQPTCGNRCVTSVFKK